MQIDEARMKKILDMALDLHDKNNLLESKLDALAKAFPRTPYRVKSSTVPGHVSLSMATEIVRDLFGFDVDEEYMMVLFERSDLYRGEVDPETGRCSYVPSPTALMWELIDADGMTSKGFLGILALLQVRYEAYGAMEPLEDLQKQVTEKREGRKKREENGEDPEDKEGFVRGGPAVSNH